MDKKRIVIALGGNALGKNLHEQMLAVRETAKAIVDLVEEGHEVVISHGNGPQVGMIQKAMDTLIKNEPVYGKVPLSVCVAMSQGYIGYDLQNALRETLLERNITKPVSTVITQVIVDEKDEAFDNPTKPIGRFLTKEEAQVLMDKGVKVLEDAGRGYRRIVASPKPVGIVEIDTIKTLLNSGQIVIAGGGGGIPVMVQGNRLKGAKAVIDKDFASSKLARLLDADCLIILTAVEKVALNFGKADECWLSTLGIQEAKTYMKEGHFAPGSMLPKVQAAVEFAESSKERFSLITLLEKAKEGITGKTGTVIK